MCAGCRERISQKELVRLQLNGKRQLSVIERKSQRYPGRSLYLCPNTACLERLLRRGEVVIKRSKYDKITVRLEQRQSDRLRYAFKFAARRLRAALGVGPRG